MHGVRLVRVVHVVLSAILTSIEDVNANIIVPFFSLPRSLFFLAKQSDMPSYNYTTVLRYCREDAMHNLLEGLFPPIDAATVTLSSGVAVTDDPTQEDREDAFDDILTASTAVGGASAVV